MSGLVAITQVAPGAVHLSVDGWPLAHTLICWTDASSPLAGGQSPRQFLATTDSSGVVTVPSDELRPGRLRVLAINPVGRVVAHTACSRHQPLGVATAQLAFARGRVDEWTMINNGGETTAEFAVLAALWRAYETVFRPVIGSVPFPVPPRIVFPDRSPAVVAFVEPLTWPTGQPRMRMPAAYPTGAAIDFTAVGGGGMLAHELAHLVHFAHLSLRCRTAVGARYLAWLASAAVRTGAPFHHTTARTSTTVAWLEAFGIFAERYYWYAHEVAGTRVAASAPLPAARLARDFVADELSVQPVLSGVMPGYFQVARLQSGKVRQLCDASDVEGGVYGRKFLMIAHESSLALAVKRFVRLPIPH